LLDFLSVFGLNLLLNVDNMIVVHAFLARHRQPFAAKPLLLAAILAIRLIAVLWFQELALPHSNGVIGLLLVGMAYHMWRASPEASSRSLPAISWGKLLYAAVLDMLLALDSLLITSRLAAPPLAQTAGTLAAIALLFWTVDLTADALRSSTWGRGAASAAMLVFGVSQLVKDPLLLTVADTVGSRLLLVALLSTLLAAAAALFPRKR